MEPLAPNGQQYGRQNDPNYIFQECADIKKAVTNITTRELSHVQSLQNAVLNDPDTSSSSPNSRELQSKTAQVMDEYRSLAQRVKKLKTNPESGAPRFKDQVGSTGRAVQQAINQFQQLDGQFNRKLKEQMARQYRIVRPEASDDEVREAVEDTSGQQVFSQALLQGDRRNQSRSALSAVQGRHEAIQKIERQMIELAELFQDMENLVVQQEAAVTNIEMKGEEVVENMDKGTEEIGTAVKTARATRKKKWWCLGISGMFSLFSLHILLYAMTNTIGQFSSLSLSSSLSSFGNLYSVPTQRATVTTPSQQSDGFYHPSMHLPLPPCSHSSPALTWSEKRNASSRKLKELSIPDGNGWSTQPVRNLEAFSCLW
jgi:syntaxin 1B/2/3